MLPADVQQHSSRDQATAEDAPCSADIAEEHPRKGNGKSTFKEEKQSRTYSRYNVNDEKRNGCL